MKKRKKKHLPTSLRQMNLNDANSKKKLERLINCNFGPGDSFVLLTYERKMDFDAAEKEMKRFLRRLREFCKKKGLPALKYIAVTEDQDKIGKEVKPHHHILIQKTNLDDLKSLWNLGIVKITPLDASGDYRGISRYLTKAPRRAHAKRWSESRNLKKPIIEYQVLKRSPDVLRAPKGYRTIHTATFVGSDETGPIKCLRAVKINPCGESSKQEGIAAFQDGEGSGVERYERSMSKHKRDRP